MKELILEMERYANTNNVPIIELDAIKFIMKYIKLNKVESILEIGTAIGYSAIMMALANPNLKITTIERDEKRYLEAVKNIKKANLEDRITLIYQDALDVVLDDMFDLVFIDAAKAQNIKFFEKFSKNLSSRGTIVTDNLNFHGLVEKDEEQIESKNLKALVRKLKLYIEYLKENEKFSTTFLSVGDGLAISVKKD